MRATRLSAFDATFLALDGPVSVGHLCLAAVLDGPVSRSAMLDRVAERIGRLGLLRRRLQASSSLAGRPWWVDDPSFRLEDHVLDHHSAEPRPAPHLSAAMIEIARTRLPRDTPLWQLHLVPELAGGGSAVVLKVHHAVVDGLGARDLLAALLAPGPDGIPDRDDWQADPGPQWSDRATQAVVESLQTARSALHLETAALQTITSYVERLSAPSRMNDHPKPAAPPVTPFNGALTAERDWAWASLPTAACLPVRRRHHSSVNDVVLAVTAGALRDWLSRRGELPIDPLVALVPIAGTQPSPEPGPAPLVRNGNHLALTTCQLPTHLPDPVDRLLAVRRAMAVAKAHPSVTTERIEALATVSAPILAPLLTRAAASLGLAEYLLLPFNVMVSTVPPGRADLQLAGVPVRATVPFPPLADGLGINVTVQAYAEDLDLGVSTAASLVPDAGEVVELLVEHYDLLCRS